MKLTGRFLIAMPHLADPNFRHTVVLVLDHDNEGCFGVIINRPGPLTVSDLCQSQQIDWKGDRFAPIYVGGPVRPTSVWIVHDGGVDVPGTTEASPGCQFTISREALGVLADMEAVHRRIYGGYSGWGAGQVESEIRQGAWIVSDADPGLVFSSAADQIWELALKQVGIDPATLVPGSGELQ